MFLCVTTFWHKCLIIFAINFHNNTLKKNYTLREKTVVSWKMVRGDNHKISTCNNSTIYGHIFTKIDCKTLNFTYILFLLKKIWKKNRIVQILEKWRPSWILKKSWFRAEKNIFLWKKYWNSSKDHLWKISRFIFKQIWKN